MIDASKLNKLQYRYVQNANCHCKVCDKVLVPSEDKIIYFRSWRRSGGAVHICMDCLNIINQLVGETDSEDFFTPVENHPKIQMVEKFGIKNKD